MADGSLPVAGRKAALAAMSWRILPLLGIGYLFALMDRVNVSFAALQMNQQLGFSATVYGLGAGLFYLAYAVFEVPSNLLLARVGARRWLARIMISWGVLAAATMFVHTPLQFYVMRFLLGMAEAGFFPGVILYLSGWYPRANRGRAISGFYFFGPLSSVVMGGLSAWLLGLHGLAGLHGWQWLFLVQGAPAALIGIAFLLWLPESPRSVAWLTAGQQDWIEREIAADADHTPARHARGILDALADPLVLQFGLLGLLTIGATVTFGISSPLLLQAAGLGTGAIGAVISAGGLLGVVGMLFAGWYSDRRHDRFATMLGGTLLMGAAFAAMAIDQGRLTLVCGCLAFGAAWSIVTLSQVSAWPDLIRGPMLGVACAAINTLQQIGAFVMPLAWGRARDLTGNAHSGLVGLTLVMIVALAMTWSLKGQVRRASGASPTMSPATA